MLPRSNTQIAGEADEEARQRDSPFQLCHYCSSDPEPTIYCPDNYDFLPHSVANDLYPDMTLEIPAFKSDHFGLGINFDRGLGICTSKSSSPESDYSGDFTMSVISGDVSNKDNIDLVQPFPVCEPIQGEGDAGIVPEAVTRSQKRSVTKAFSADQVENDDARAKQKPKTDADSGEKTRIQLACPFQKLDSHKHHECLKYALHRIKDVKQHVYRRHKQPDYYCARCGDIFKNADERDEHSRSINCDNLELPNFEGISELTRNKLNKSSSRGLDIQGQWFEMWDIIFPDVDRPESAWVGSYMEEMVPLLRSLWKNKSSEILAKAQREQTTPVDSGFLDNVVESIFNCLEDEASASLGRRARGTCSQNQQSLLGQQSPTSTSPSRLITDPAHQLMCGEPHAIFSEIDAESDAGLRADLVFGV